MDKEQAKELLEKYLNGTCTPEEKALFERLSNNVLRKRLAGRTHPDYEAIKASILERLPPPDRKPLVRRLVPYAIAASVVICLSVAAILYLNREPAVDNMQVQVQDDVPPGGNRALLTLSNGQQIVLTDADNGQLAEQAGITITKTGDGELVYSVANTDANTPVGYNTTETPKGGQYQVVLADGSKVWLNAASSLRYPTRFAGKERVVELTGEAFFEIAHNEAMPFKVKTSKQTVSVLGTHFNVNAYDDEASVTTTLLEGSVRVSAVEGSASETLRPGQQSSLIGGRLNIIEGNTDEAVAWKDGYFRFRDEDIQSIMRKLARWYDIDVQYEGNVSGEYYARISRFKNISQVLIVLAETGTVHFKVEGRRVTVMQ